jgi:3-phenylpropionate/trans-cinnamate dioxygenase ferredoxin reductase component
LNRYDVLVVGSGHGGVSAASALRQFGYGGTIAIVSADRGEPYERPPLSKDYLTGDKDERSIHLRGPAFWQEKQIELILGETVTSVDSEEHCVTTGSGNSFGYGKLIWAAGGEPRRLTCDGHDLAGVHTIRNRVDVDALRAALGAASRIVVIGGGYIGLEAAASLTKVGKQVTVVEALDRLLARVAGHAVSQFFLEQHRRHGVGVRLNASVSCIEGVEGQVCGVRLADGTVIPAEIVIVGIGIQPHVEPIAVAGADIANGVTVDGHCRTTLPDVYAIGDCASHRNAFGPDHPVRLESVQNAADQGAVVAHDICGSSQPYAAMPWFWSNQYDIKLQTVGLNTGYDQALMRGDPATGRFSVIYLRGGCVAALDCVNMVKDYVQGRALVEQRAAIDPARLTDPDTPLKALALQD